MFGSRPTVEHFAAFQADQNPLEDVRSFVQAALLETSLEKKSIAGLMLAVEEAITNIIRHGYLFGPGRIRVQVRRNRQWVSIVISDTGRPYSIDSAGSPDAAKLADTARRGGLGQFLMKKVTDRLDYQRIGDENILTLSKRLGRPAPERSLRPSLQRRVAVRGSFAVVALVAIGGWLVQMQSTRRLTDEFFEHWNQFGKTAAAAASQHILNDRSDVEFDQLAVDLKAAHPDLSRLMVLANETINDSTVQVIRAYSESPELVREPYRSPAATTEFAGSDWNVSRVNATTLHFSADVKVGARVLGAVVWEVRESVLTDRIATERQRVITWALVAMLGGIVLVVAGSAWMARPLANLAEALRIARERGAEARAVVAGPDEVQQVVAAFNDATASVARAERDLAERDQARREIEASEQVQRALLPQQLPDLPGYEFAATCRMARHVGGDYYDAIALESGRVMVVIADVAGKGLPAALIMTALRTATRMLAPLNPAPRDILSALHRFMRDNHPAGPFVTACAVVLDTSHHTIEVASAGHTPAILCRGNGEPPKRINPRGRPLGIESEPSGFERQIESEVLTLGIGDQLALFTDGLVDTRTGRGETIGMKRLEDYLHANIHRSPSDVTAGIIAEAEAFVGPEQVLMDDLTFLIIRRSDPADAARTVDRLRSRLEVPSGS
ncbi:MAG: SpoIIE family protein phosphatase [Candidatus Zixiibacteriota bacterium]